MVWEGAGPIYHTKPFIEKTGTSYKFRIEIVDPDKMAFRFLVNDEALGEFSMPAADALAYKDLKHFLFGGLNSMGNTTRPGTYFLDYLAVEQR